MAGQNDVGTAGKVFAVKPEAIAEPVQNLPDKKLRRGVLLLNALHDPPALLRCTGVHYNTALTCSTYRLALS